MKKLFFLAIIFFISSSSYSQKFMHGVGTGFFVEKIKDVDPTVSVFFMYSPRVNLSESESMSLSLGIPLSIGFGADYGQGYGGNYSSFDFMINTPLIVNVNFGAGSSKQNNERVGLFIGGGFAHQFNVHSFYNESYGNTSSTSSTYGPTGNLGFRFAVGSHKKNIETRFSYMRGLAGDYMSDIYGIGALFNF